jgi:hypothetical protein
MLCLRLSHLLPSFTHNAVILIRHVVLILCAVIPHDAIIQNAVKDLRLPLGAHYAAARKWVAPSRLSLGGKQS